MVFSLSSGINSLDDLVNQNLVHYGTQDGSAVVATLREQKLETYSKMYDHMMEYKTLMPNTSSAVDRVRRSYGKSKGIFERQFMVK